MKRQLPKYLLLVADLVAIVAAFRVAFALRYEAGLSLPNANLAPPTFWSYGFAIFLALATWVLIFLLYGVDHFPGAGESTLAVSKLITAAIFLIASLLAGMYLAHTFYSRLLFVFLALLVVMFLAATRIIYRSALARMRKHGVGLRRVVIVGHSELASELAERIGRRVDLHYELAGFLAPARMHANGHAKDDCPGALTSGSQAMARELARMNIDELLFAIPIRRESETLEFVAHCQEQGIAIKTVPEYYDLHTSQIEAFNLDGIPILQMKKTALLPSLQFLKRVSDLFLAVITLPVTLPLMAAIGAGLYVSGRKVIRREGRIGMGGRPFTLYRFDASARNGARPSEASANSTWVERFFLQYSIAELPQIWNVLRGDMSFVGPQPESPERVRHYSAWHRRRLQLKPGLTGLAQVNGLREKDSSDLKTKYDLEYAANYTPLVDLALVLATVNTLVGRRKTSRPGGPFSPGFTGGAASTSASTLQSSGT